MNGAKIQMQCVRDGKALKLTSDRQTLNRRDLLIGAAALGATGCAAPPRVMGSVADILIDDVALVPMDREVILPNHSVAVTGGIVSAVAPQAELQNMQARQRINGRGLYLMPSLVDLHVHVEGEPERDFPLFLANGITAVRNMSDREFDHLRIGADVEAARLQGPRYLVSGPSLHEQVLTSVTEVAPLLDRHVALGYDTLKIHGDLPADVYDALISGSRERGLIVSGHVQRRRELAVSLRMNSIEHMEEFLYVPGRRVLDDDIRAAEIARQVADSGVWVCPTLAIYSAITDYVDDDAFERLKQRPELHYLPRAVRDVWLGNDTNPYRHRNFSEATRQTLARDRDRLAQFAMRLHEAGALFIFGTDAAGALVQGFAAHQELHLLVRAGLSPFQALKSATVNARTFMRSRLPAAGLRSGERAELLLVRGNPLAAVENVRRPAGLMNGGRWYGAEDLEQLLQGVLERRDPTTTSYPMTN